MRAAIDQGDLGVPVHGSVPGGSEVIILRAMLLPFCSYAWVIKQHNAATGGDSPPVACFPGNAFPMGGQRLTLTTSGYQPLTVRVKLPVSPTP